jgi:ubiquinone biosynthesis protein Coq4
MKTLTDAEQQWQDQAFESFFNMVKAPDGDFDAIAQLSSTLNDTNSLNLLFFL